MNTNKLVQIQLSYPKLILKWLYYYYYCILFQQTNKQKRWKFQHWMNKNDSKKNKMKIPNFFEKLFSAFIKTKMLFYFKIFFCLFIIIFIRSCYLSASIDASFSIKHRMCGILQFIYLQEIREASRPRPNDWFNKFLSQQKNAFITANRAFSGLRYNFNSIKHSTSILEFALVFLIQLEIQCVLHKQSNQYDRII